MGTRVTISDCLSRHFLVWSYCEQLYAVVRNDVVLRTASKLLWLDLYELQRAGPGRDDPKRARWHTTRASAIAHPRCLRLSEWQHVPARGGTCVCNMSTGASGWHGQHSLWPCLSSPCPSRSPCAPSPPPPIRTALIECVSSTRRRVCCWCRLAAYCPIPSAQVPIVGGVRMGFQVRMGCARTGVQSSATPAAWPLLAPTLHARGPAMPGGSVGRGAGARRVE